MLLRRLYTLFTALLCLFLIHTVTTKPWLQTDLAALLPAEQQPDALLVAADHAGKAQLNGQIVMLTGSANAETAFQAAAEIASKWRESGVFAEVDSSVMPDLDSVRADMQRLAQATLPQEQARLLFQEPKRYFQTRAEDAANPFAAVSPLSLEQDWLGFGRFVAAKANPQSRLQWNMDNGMLFTEADGKTWVWLRGRLKTGDHFSGNDKLLPLINDSRAIAQKHGAETLAAGGALFAAASKTAAEAESRTMSMVGTLATFALLLWVFRSARVFWLALPLAAGMLTGLAAALAVFGEVHILTIVIGTSLVGMLVDFPLHWLAPSVFRQSENGKWSSESAMKHVLPSFAVSLLITVLGYALLWFTPLTVLRQTAVFSGFALLGAFGATVLWLPPLFRRYQAKAVPFAKLTERLLRLKGRLNKRLHKRGWLALGGIFLAVGLWRSDWHDDIRQWVNMPSEMLAQVQRIGELSGTDFGGRYIVTEAASEDALLAKNAELAQALQPLVAQGKLGGFQSLDQFVAPVSEQEKLQNRLRELAGQPENPTRPSMAAAVSGRSGTRTLRRHRAPERFGRRSRRPHRRTGHCRHTLGRQTRPPQRTLPPHAQPSRMAETRLLRAGVAAAVADVRRKTRQQNPCRAACRRRLHRCRARLAGHSREPVCHVRAAARFRHRRGLRRLCRYRQTHRRRTLGRHAARRRHHRHLLRPTRIQQHPRRCRLRADGNDRRGV